MARVAGGGRRVIPGLRDASVALERRFDARFCMSPLDAPCGWCRRAAAIERGEPVTVTGEHLWRALFNDHRSQDWREFMHDKTPYIVTGDRLETIR